MLTVVITCEPCVYGFMSILGKFFSFSQFIRLFCYNNLKHIPWYMCDVCNPINKHDTVTG